MAGTALLGRAGGRIGAVAADAARWRQARRTASNGEWRRWTRTAYTVIYYHRLAGEGKPGQERLDLPAAQFDRQLRLLRRLGFHSVGPEELLAFHDGSVNVLPPRSYVVTADDGFLDCIGPFLDHADVSPILFVPTAEVGGRSWWAGDEPLAGWEDLRRLATAGVPIGSHADRHEPLTDQTEAAVDEQLATSRRRLTDELSRAPALLAYPHGRHDAGVRAAAARAGFRMAFTTDPGRNGSGTNPLALRRIGIKAWDSDLSFLWKVLTGQLLPERWERRRISRAPAGYRPRPPSSVPPDG